MQTANIEIGFIPPESYANIEGIVSVECAVLEELKTKMSWLKTKFLHVIGILQPKLFSSSRYFFHFTKSLNAFTKWHCLVLCGQRNQGARALGTLEKLKNSNQMFKSYAVNGYCITSFTKVGSCAEQMVYLFDCSFCKEFTSQCFCLWSLVGWVHVWLGHTSSQHTQAKQFLQLYV